MAELRHLKHARVYLARSWLDARNLYWAETKAKDYAGIGLRLGYPVCCVEAAEAVDEMTWDSEAREWRQTNLVAVGIEASTSADFHCNHLLTESAIASCGPVSCIAHYPCRLDCGASSEIGEVALSIASRRRPQWHEVLIPLLKAPVLYWPDTNWPRTSGKSMPVLLCSELQYAMTEHGRPSALRCLSAPATFHSRLRASPQARFRIAVYLCNHRPPPCFYPLIF